MSCAAALSKLGKKVLILEQHYVAGGFTHEFSRKGYSWDVGVHCLGEMDAHRLPARILAWLSNNKIEMTSLGKVYERFSFPDNFTVEYPDSQRNFQENLNKMFPDEVEAIEKYFTMVKEASKSARSYFAMKALPGWLDKTLSTVVETGKTKWWSKTTAEVLGQITNNKKLKAALCAIWGYYGAAPSESSFAIHALVVRHFWNGGFYPKGGSSSIAEHLLSTVRESGGETVVRASVQEVIVKNNKAIGVRMENGAEFFAKKIISAAGVRNTVTRLLPNEQKQKSWVQNLGNLKQSPCHLCLYLGYKGNIKEAGASQANQWLFSSLDMENTHWDPRIKDSYAPVLYMSFPSLKDPDYDPGTDLKHTGEVVTFVPWESFKPWFGSQRGKRSDDYIDFKRSIEQRLLEQMQKYNPKLMDLLDYHELSTPLSTDHYTKSPEGGIYGLEATPRRFLASDLRAKAGIKNLYMTGGDVASLGVIGAMMGGVITASSLEPKILKGFIFDKGTMKKSFLH